MRFTILLLSFALPAFAAPRTKPAPTQETRPPFILALRGGFILDNPDNAVVGRWEHQAFKSYQVALSGFYSFPQAWKEIYFFAGPEFYYRSATEELSGRSYTASVDISIYQFMVTGGVAFTPKWADGWGASFATAFEVYGRKTAALDSQGFTQDLGTEGTRDEKSALPISVNLVGAVFYDFGNLRPQLVLESNATLGLGLAYAF